MAEPVIPEYTILEGGWRPEKIVNHETGEVCCAHCGHVSQPDRWQYWIDFEAEEEYAALACSKCELPVCYLVVLLSGGDRYLAARRLGLR